MNTRFIKMHGCGNDFAVIDARRSALAMTPPVAVMLGNRHTGIGFDQLVLIETADGSDGLMRIWNADGSQAAMCGNAARCVADILMRETRRGEVSLQTSSGSLSARRQPNGNIEVDMGIPSFQWDQIPLARPMDTLWLDLPEAMAAVSMGNPHATLFTDDLSSSTIKATGRRLEHHEIFPQRANIGFAQVIDPTTIRLRVWERGAGLTLACGSGSCAAVVNAHRRGLTERRVNVLVDGGELTIEWLNNGHVLMSGPVATSFTGEIALPRLSRPDHPDVPGQSQPAFSSEQISSGSQTDNRWGEP